MIAGGLRDPVATLLSTLSGMAISWLVTGGRREPVLTSVAALTWAAIKPNAIVAIIFFILSSFCCSKVSEFYFTFLYRKKLIMI